MLLNVTKYDVIYVCSNNKKMNEDAVVLKLVNPYTMIVSGQTGSGKTQFVKRLIDNQTEMHVTPLKRVVYVYTVDQPAYQQMHDSGKAIEFHRGLPSDLTFDGEPTLLVLDDMMLELQNDKRLAQFFTKMRHTNLSTIFLTQNIYFNSKYATTVTRNAQYLVLFPNLRDRSMINTLGRQIYPEHPSFILAAFDDAIKTPYGYLFVDLKSDTDEKLRVRTNVFPGESVVVFRPTS